MMQHRALRTRGAPLSMNTIDRDELTPMVARFEAAAKNRHFRDQQVRNLCARVARNIRDLHALMGVVDIDEKEWQQCLNDRFLRPGAATPPPTGIEPDSTPSAPPAEGSSAMSAVA